MSLDRVSSEGLKVLPASGAPPRQLRAHPASSDQTKKQSAASSTFLGCATPRQAECSARTPPARHETAGSRNPEWTGSAHTLAAVEDAAKSGTVDSVFTAAFDLGNLRKTVERTEIPRSFRVHFSANACGRVSVATERHDDAF